MDFILLLVYRLQKWVCCKRFISLFPNFPYYAQTHFHKYKYPGLPNNLRIKPLLCTLVAVMKNAFKWLAATPRLGLERGRLYDESLVVLVAENGGIRDQRSGIGDRDWGNWHYRHRQAPTTAHANSFHYLLFMILYAQS